jgi:single-stranded DNA-binding protein
MSRGGSIVATTGNVGDPIVFGKTPKNEDCCSFMLALEERNQTFPTWVKVNIYDAGNVTMCRERLLKGASVTVYGKLMNRRRSSNELAVEVKASEIIFNGSTVRNNVNQEQGR